MLYILLMKCNLLKLSSREPIMFPRIIQLKKGNHTYQYLKIVQTARYKEKIVQKTILNFGNIEHWPKERLKELLFKLNQFCALEMTPSNDDISIQSALDYGASYLLDAIWKELKLSACIRSHTAKQQYTIDIVPPVKAMVFNRLLDPSSKLQVSEWVTTQVIDEVYPHEIPLHHYYRSLEYVMEHKQSLEEDVFWSVNDIFNIDLSLVFYDLTSSYFEGECCPLSRYGYSRDHRPDRRQIEIGLVVNRDGIPIAHEVWEGNVKDATTVPDTLAALQNRFGIKRCVFVGDNGMATPETIKQLRESKYEYITSLKILKDDRALRIIHNVDPDTSQEFIKLKDNLLIYEVPSPGEGFHDDERVIICYNPHRAERTKQNRTEKLDQAQGYLQNVIDTHSKQGKRIKPDKVLSMVERHLRKKGVYKYFDFHYTPEGVFTYQRRIDVIEQAEKTDGIWILLTNVHTLSPQDIALGYKSLYEVEHAFRDIKSFLRIRPIYHYKNLRVKGHVFICVLAYLMEKLLEKKLRSSGLNYSAQKALQMLQSIRMVKYEVAGIPMNKITKFSKEQKQIYNAVGICNIPVLHPNNQLNRRKNLNVV